MTNTYDHFTGVCGHTVKNVPPYLRDCVGWTCRKCAAHDEKSPIKDEPEETHREYQARSKRGRRAKVEVAV